MSPTTSASRRVSISEIGTNCRQQAPHPCLHETVNPSACAFSTDKSTKESAKYRKKGSSFANRVGPAGTGISNRIVLPAILSSAVAFTHSAAFSVSVVISEPCVF
ncbi:MAG TPA: hypothetical protein PKY50_03515 [Candidatus Competibacter sp.]|nr:hypothetical protein [Candidatus Competibacter sp.]